MTDDDEWGWAVDPRYSLWCLTFTRGLNPADVLRRYGADPDRAQVLARTERSDLYEQALRGGTVLRVGMHSGWSFCFEDVGGAGSRPGPLRALSQGTETVSLLQGGDGMNLLSHWHDGQCRERFEPGATDWIPQGTGPFWDLVRSRHQAHPGRPGLLLALEVITQHTGVYLDRTTITGPLLTAYLADEDRTPDPVPSLPPTPPKQGSTSLGRYLGSVRPTPRPPET
ncbi:hypothetical protein GCM10023080_044160 [Streptomyces pseudoechinosporeus]